MSENLPWFPFCKRHLNKVEQKPFVGPEGAVLLCPGWGMAGRQRLPRDCGKEQNPES